MGSGTAQQKRMTVGRCLGSNTSSGDAASAANSVDQDLLPELVAQSLCDHACDVTGAATRWKGGDQTDGLVWKIHDV